MRSVQNFLNKVISGFWGISVKVLSWCWALVLCEEEVEEEEEVVEEEEVLVSSTVRGRQEEPV